MKGIVVPERTERTLVIAYHFVIDQGKEIFHVPSSIHQRALAGEVEDIMLTLTSSSVHCISSLSFLSEE